VTQDSEDALTSQYPSIAVKLWKISLPPFLYISKTDKEKGKFKIERRYIAFIMQANTYQLDKKLKNIGLLNSLHHTLSSVWCM